MLGNLHLAFEPNTNSDIQHYCRELDLNDAVARLRFARGGVTFTRELFASKPDEVLVLRFERQPRRTEPIAAASHRGQVQL